MRAAPSSRRPAGGSAVRSHLHNAYAERLQPERPIEFLVCRVGCGPRELSGNVRRDRDHDGRPADPRQVPSRWAGIGLSFTITSGVTTITGTSTGPYADAAPTHGYCQHYVDSFQTIDDVTLGGTLNYQASVSAPAGTSYVTGFLSVNSRVHNHGESQHFQIGFASSVEAPPPGPASISLTPPSATNTVSTQHTVTATSTDSGGQATPGITVRFSVSGSTSAAGSCVTGTDGACSFTYTGPDLPGADAIVAYADTDGSGTKGSSEPGAEATKSWILPTATAGQVTGGGQIPNAAGNSGIAFGFTAKSGQQGIKGECSVVDIALATNIKIKCTDVTDLVVSGTHATLFGPATVNGVSTTYRIDVNDNGEPGRTDTFKIVTASGYSASGTLSGGNIQVH